MWFYIEKCGMMEKLIKLLNERGNKMLPWVPEYYSKWGNIYLKFKAPLSWEWKIENEVICGKRYEFIKWLVENDKIDIKKLIIKGEMRSWWDFDNKKWDEETWEESWNKYFSELCLMILAIQDEPIEFLISILK